MASMSLGGGGAQALSLFGGNSIGVRNVGVKTGLVAGSATAKQMQDRPGSLVMFKALSTNAGNLYIGTSLSVAVPGTTDSDAAGWELDAGQELGWLPCNNLSNFFIIGDNAGDDLMFCLIT